MFLNYLLTRMSLSYRTCQMCRKNLSYRWSPKNPSCRPYPMIRLSRMSRKFL